MLKQMVRACCAAVLGLVAVLSSPAQADGERIALLIGNADYDANGTIDASVPPAGGLSDLPNACKDVEAVEAKLVLLGWSEETEISRHCNLKKASIIEQLDHFIEKFNSMDNPVGFIYFAGHGMQVNGVGYVFGVNAKVDIDATADTMIKKPKNALFVSSGVDIARYLKSNVGDVYGGALVVVLDACRDNPVATLLRNKYKSVPISALSTSPDSMIGMLLAYSTKGGAYANDGLGELSPYAESLVNSMREDLSIEEAINQAAFSLYNRTKDTDRVQEPSREGIFPPPPPRRCFARNCGGTAPGAHSRFDPPNPGSPLQPLLRTGGNPAFALASFAPAGALEARPAPAPWRARRQSQASAPARLPVPQKTDIFRAVKSSAIQRPDQLVDDRILVDVYYCAGYDSSPQLQRLAERAVEQIRSYALSPDGQRLIKSIRLREHPKAYNELQGRRFVRDLIVYEDSSVQEAELARALGTVVGAPFVAIKNLDVSPGYLKLYACEGASPSASSSRIFLQVPSSGSLPLARSVIEDLSARFPGINVAGGIEVLPRQSPMSSEVRYFHEEDAMLAGDIADQIRQATGIPISPKFVPGFKVSALTMEIWFGRDSVKSNASPSQRPPTQVRGVPPPAS